MPGQLFRKPLAYRAGQIKEMALSRSARQSLVMFSGSFANSVLSLIGVIIISRTLGPEQYGILATFNALTTILIGATDLGLGTTSIKQISDHLAHNFRRAAVQMKVVVKLEFLIGGLIALTGLFFARQVAELLGGEHLLFAVRLAFFSGAVSSAGAFMGPFFVAHEQFVRNAVIPFAGAVTRVIAIVIMFVLARLTLNNVLWLYALLPVVFFFVSFYFLPKSFLTQTTREEEKEAFAEIFHFSKWILLSYVAMSIAGRIDVLLLSRYKGSAAVGLYAAALQLASVLPLIIAAITTVLLPKVSRMKRKEEFLGYVKKVAFAAVLLALALSPVLFFGDFFIRLIFGSRFDGAFGVFRIIFLGYLTALVANPVALVLYALNRPRVFTFFNYIQLGISVLLNMLLIPLIGGVGAAVAFLAMNLFGSIASVIYTLRVIQKLPE